MIRPKFMNFGPLLGLSVRANICEGSRLKLSICIVSHKTIFLCLSAILRVFLRCLETLSHFSIIL